MAKAKESVIAKSRAQRDAMMKRPYRAPHPLVQDKRERVIELLKEGATLSEVCTLRKVTSYGVLYHTRNIDPVFDADVRAAMAQGAEAAIAEAEQVSRDAALSGNTDMMRIAESFHRCTQGYAEKVAPRDYGQLIKLGGHDGGALAVQVVSYALPAIEAQALESVGKSAGMVAVSRARIADASFEDLDPNA